MKKFLFIPLTLVLAAVLILGSRFAGKPLYTREEIESFNKEATERISRSDAFVDEAGEENSLPSDGSPVIRVNYPSGLENSGTVQSDRVYLRFDGENEIISASLNGMRISTTEAMITTAGTYEVVVEDVLGNVAEFEFTLIK